MTEIPWNIVFPNLGWIVTIIAIGGAVWGIRGWFSKIETRLKSIEENPLLLATKNLTVEFWSNILHDVFEKVMIKGNPLTINEIDRRIALTKKLQDKTITPNEAKELNNILNKELEEARANNNMLAILAILLLLGLLIAISEK